MPTFLRRRRTWLIAVPVVAVLLAVGGPFVYIHFIEGKPAAKLSFDDLATTTTVAGSTGTTTVAGASGTATTGAGATTAAARDGIDGTWKVGTGSQAGYRVPETLFGQKTEAVGRTTGVTGSLTIAGTTVSAATVTVDLATVKSDQSQRDGQFTGRIMNTASFPTATFTLTAPVSLGTVPADKVEVPLKLTGDLKVHGATKSVTVDVTARRNGNTIEVTGTIPVTFADFGIANPSFGPASVGDTGTIEFALVLT